MGRAGSQVGAAEISTGGRRMQGASEGRDSRDTWKVQSAGWLWKRLGV